MALIQKNVVFLVSVLLLLQGDAFCMKEEGFFSKWFGKKKTDSKENKGNVSCNQSNKKTPNFEEGLKMVDMKQLAQKKKKDLEEDWVILVDQSLEECSISSRDSNQDLKMLDIKQVATEKDEELMSDWEQIDDENSEEYVSHDPLTSNDKKTVMLYRLEQIKEAINLN